MPGINQKVQEHLFELHRIGLDGQPRLNLHANGDAIFLRVAGEDDQRFIDDILHADLPNARCARASPSID